MTENNFIALDVETGGLTPRTSLLTACFAVVTKQFDVIDTLNLAFKPKDDEYVVTAKALSINNINLVEHDRIAISFSEGGKRLREFLVKHANSENRLTPLGKNVPFDIKRVTENVLNHEEWGKFVSYRLYDVTSLIILAKRRGVLPLAAPEGLEALCAYLGIEDEAPAHTANGDVMRTIGLTKFLEEALNEREV